MEQKIPFVDIGLNSNILNRIKDLPDNRNWLQRLLVGRTLSEQDIRDTLSQMEISFTEPIASARFYLENPEKFKDAKWNFARRPNGGYGTPLWYKEGPKYFEFLRRNDGSYVVFEFSEISHKREWPEDQRIIETMHKKEAEELMGRGYRLVNTYEASVPNEDGDHDLGTSYTDRRIYVLAKEGLEGLVSAH